MKRIYIVRHGQTYINRYDKMQGWCDTPLTWLFIQGLLGGFLGIIAEKNMVAGIIGVLLS